MDLRLSLTAEDANRNLHKFKGKAELSDERLLSIPLSPGAGGSPAKTAGGWCWAGDTAATCLLWGANRCYAPAALACMLLRPPCKHACPPPLSCLPAEGGMPTVEIPVTMNEMLLRGCMLKNSKCIAGLAVYTGKETRIQMNAAKTPLKIGEWGWGWGASAAVLPILGHSAECEG